MSEPRMIELEVLSGPLDGCVVRLQTATEWSQAGTGSLSFPWDEELGQPQARLAPDDKGWSLQPVKSSHGTYRVNEGERVEDVIRLNTTDILKASTTWLLVKQIE